LEKKPNVRFSRRARGDYYGASIACRFDAGTADAIWPVELVLYPHRAICGDLRGARRP
jgi:hypothetical protein